MTRTSKIEAVALAVAVVLAAVFVVMKMNGGLSWPWLWVLSPLWAPFLIMALLVVAVIIAVWTHDPWH